MSQDGWGKILENPPGSNHQVLSLPPINQKLLKNLLPLPMPYKILSTDTGRQLLI